MNREPGEVLQVETQRFILRSMRPEDINDDYVSWWNDAEIQEGLNSNPRNWGRQQALQHIAKFDDTLRFHLGIRCKEQGRLIGFFAMFISPAVKIAKTNIVIGDKAYWGKQVVQEIRSRMIDMLFDDFGMDKVKGEITGRNYASIFNYKALGFRNEGILKDELLSHKGGRTDLFIFGLLKEEWQAHKLESNV